MRTIKSILVALIISISTSTIQANEAQLQAKVTGHGSPVVFLPGFACSGDVWNDIIKPIEKQYECHTISYPGFNGIPAPDTLWYQTVADQVNDYINKLVEKPIIVGHSLGGTLAMEMAIRQSKCSKIILVDALPCIAQVMMPGVALESLIYDSPYNKNIMKMNDEQFHAMANQMAGFMVRNEEKKKLIVEWMAQADRKAYTHGYTDLLKTDLRESIASIDIPVLVLAAVPFNLEQTEQIISAQYQNLKDKKIAYIENSAHFIMYDQPEWLISQIQSFLN